MTTVSQIVIEMSANVARLRQDMDAAKGVVGDAMSSIKGYADIASRALIGVGVGLSVIGAGKFLASLVMDVAEAQAGLLKMSQVTGATVEGLSAIRGMAKLTGTDMESVGTAMVKLAKNVETGSAATEKGLNAIGMSTKDLQGLKSDEMYKKIADTLNQYEEGAKKTAVATELMGKAGAQQLPLMKALAENGDLVAKTTTEQAEQAEHLERNITRLSMAQQAWKKIVGAELVPVLDSVVSVLIKMQTESNGTLDAAKKYSADGSIKSWAQSAAIAVAYVIDFLLGLKAVFVVVGSALAAFAASSVQALGGIADLLIAVVKGQYSSIPGIVKSTLAAVSTIVQAAGEDISDAWSKTRVVDKLRDQFQDDAQDAGEALDKVKKKIGALGETAGASVEKINALGKALNELLNKLNNPDIDAALVKEQELLTKAFQVGALGLNSYVRAMSLAILESKTFKDANEAIAKSLSENEAIIQTNRQAIEDAAKSVADGNLQLTNEIATLGMTTLEREIYNVRLRESIDLNRINATAIGDERDMLIKQAQALADGRVALLQQKDAVEKNQSAWASLSGVTKDFFTDLLTNGTKAFGNLWQTIKKFFIDLAAQFATKFVINAVLGGSIAGSSTGIAGSLINSLFSGGRGGDGIGGGGEGSMLGAGASAIGMLGGISSSVGAMTSAYTGAMAAGQGFLGSIGAAGTALTTSGGVLGAAAGVLAAIPVWGWAILAAGALYAAFGGKRDPGFKVDNNLTNVGNSASHFTDSAISKFDISGRGTDSAEYQAAFKPFVSAVQALDKMLAEQLLGADTLAKIRANMNAVNNASSWENLDKAGIEKGTTAFLKQRYGVIFDEVDAKIAATVRGFTGTSDQLLQFIASVVNVMGALKDNATYFKSVLGQTITVGELAALATAGETLTQTLTRVVTVFSATNGVAALMGKDVSTAFGAVGLASLAARQNLIDLAGGIQALDALSKSYYQNYYSDSERAAMKLKGDTAAIKATFDSLGIAVPLSVADMRKLIEAQDLATVAGRATWAALMKVADAFYAVNGAAAAVVAPGSLLTINRPGPNTEAISRAGLESTAAVVMRLAEQQSNSVLAAYNAQSTATQTLLTTANGSVGALSAVTAGMYAMRDATAAFLMQVMQTKASIDSMLTNTITTLKLQGMTKEEQYAFYQAQADTARQRSLTSTDPLEIQRQAQIVNNAVNSAQSLLTAEQRAQTNPTQIANLEKYNAQVQANLDKVAKDAKDASDAFLAKLDAKFKVITDAQGDIQKRGSEAADKNLLAANTRKRFEVGFTANVPGFSQITEVGG